MERVSPIRHWRGLLCCVAIGLLLLISLWAERQNKIVPPPTREEWINRIDEQEGVRPLIQTSGEEPVLRLATKASELQLLSLHFPPDSQAAPVIAQRAQAPFVPIALGPPEDPCQLALCLLVDGDTLWVGGAGTGAVLEERRLEIVWSNRLRMTQKLSLLCPEEELYGFLADTPVGEVNPDITIRLLTANYLPLYETTLSLPPS